MAYTLEQIKQDVAQYDSRQFYLKYIVRSDNWYFENVLNYSLAEIVKATDDFRMTVSESLGISFNSIMIVGSSKIGYSLSPTEKMFLPFSVDGDKRAVSDIDVAIISSDLFMKFWWLFRKSYSSKYAYIYKDIYNEIYRGYINEKYINRVDECRREWAEIATVSKKKVAEQLFMKHEITYRIYRSWEDFEEYNLKNIEKIRIKMTEDGNGTF